jgi:GR25 family glycosyltransferase involved in LPS biosynthesis
MKVFVLNLAERTDRMARAKEQLDSFDIPFTRVEAIPGGWKGCRDTHLDLLAHLRKMRWNSDYHFPLVLEDDVLFLDGWQNTLRDARIHMPLGWGILYLGCSPQEPLTKWHDNLYVAKNCKTTHAIMYNNSREGVVDYILDHRKEIDKIDDYYRTVIQNTFPCYTLFPLGATQFQSQSDTCKRSDVSTIQTNYDKYCK